MLAPHSHPLLESGVGRAEEDLTSPPKRSPTTSTSSATEGRETMTRLNKAEHTTILSSMHRSQSSSRFVSIDRSSGSSASLNSSYSPRRSILPRNGGHAGFHWSSDNIAPDVQQQPQHVAGWTSASNDARVEAAITTGRSLLNRPKLDAESFLSRCDRLQQLDAIFTASAAETPIRRHSATTALKPCLSTSSSNSSAMLRRSSTTTTTTTTAAGGDGKNEQFPSFARASTSYTTARHAVTFSHQQVREYEVTLGDNPSVSSGAPLSLGWRYNPKESIVSLRNNVINESGNSDGNAHTIPYDDSNDHVVATTTEDEDDNNESNISCSSIPSSSAVFNHPPSHSRPSPSSSSFQHKQRIRRSLSDFKLSDRERHRLISANPHVSLEELHNVLQSVAQIRLDRKETLLELCDEERRRRITIREDTQRKEIEMDDLRKRVENNTRRRREDWYAVQL